MSSAGESGDSGTVRAGSPDDLPAIVSLYNAAHACRPWTHERPEDWNRLPQATWRPGSGVRVVESEEKITGYAITTGRSFGDHRFTLSVDEMAAYTADAARLLLSDLAASAWRMRIGSFTVREPPDGLVGRLARHLGCHHEQEFPPTGEMMAAILNRNRLLEMLRPELRRREGHHAVGDRQGKGTSPPAAARPVGQDGAFEELARGALISEDHVLIRLLLGYVSATDALSLGTTIPDRHRDVCSAWFPGAACPSLPAPYAHRLDRY